MIGKFIQAKYEIERLVRYLVTGGPHHKTRGLYLDGFSIGQRYFAPKAIELRTDSSVHQLEVFLDNRPWFTRWLLVVRWECNRQEWAWSADRGKHGLKLFCGPVSLLIPSEMLA